MLRNNLKSFEHRTFYSMIDRDDPQVIADYFATNIENWLIRNRGELIMRPGLTARGSKPNQTNLGAATLSKSDGTKVMIRVINGDESTPTLRYRGLDVMNDTKDRLDNPMVTEQVTDLINQIATDQPDLTHVSMSVPMNTQAEAIAERAGNDFAVDPEVYTQRWTDAIHNAGLKVMHRGTDCYFEGIYDFPMWVGPDRYPVGTPSDVITGVDRANWLGRVYNYIVNHPNLFADGDIWAPFPEATGHGIFSDATSFLPSTGAGVQQNYADFFIGMKEVSEAAFAIIDKHDIVFAPSHNYSEIRSGWIPSRLHTAIGMLVFDHYGTDDEDHSTTEMQADLDAIYATYNLPLFHQEWGDYWSLDVTHTSPVLNQADHTTYLESMYAVFQGFVDAGKMVGFNYWRAIGGFERLMTDSDAGVGWNYVTLYPGTVFATFLAANNAGASNSAKFQHSENGTTWIDSTSGGGLDSDKTWVFTQADDAIYGVSAGQDTIKHDGTTVTTPDDIPQGIAIEWWKNHLWVLRDDQAFFSNPNAPETFDEGTDFININLGDGSLSVGLRGTSGGSGRLFVGKERSVWYITGVSSEDFALAPLTHDHGVASHESMLNAHNSVYCLDREGDIRELYRSGLDNPYTKLLSADIEGTTSTINLSAIETAASVLFDNYLLFFVPTGSSTVNNLVIVYDLLANENKGGFIKFTNWDIARAIVFTGSSEPTLYLFDSRTENGQTYQWLGTSDNGAEIEAVYETKVYDYGFPNRSKRFKFHDVFAPAQGNVTIEMYSSVDRYGYTKLDEIDLVGIGGKLLGIDWVLGEDFLGDGGFVKQRVWATDGGGQGEGYTEQIKLVASSAAIQLRVRQFTNHFIPKGLR